MKDANACIRNGLMGKCRTSNAKKTHDRNKQEKKKRQEKKRPYKDSEMHCQVNVRYLKEGFEGDNTARGGFHGNGEQLQTHFNHMVSVTHITCIDERCEEAKKLPHTRHPIRHLANQSK